MEQDGIKLTIYNSALTKASDAGDAYEREINTLDCFFYPKGLTNEPCVFYHHEDVSGNTTGRVDVLVNVVEDAISKIFPTEGECEVFVIANLPSGVKPNGVSFDNDPENIYTSLDNLSEYVLQIADDETPDFDPSYDAEGKPFVMTGLAVGERTSKKNCTATVMLKRAASKLTLRVAIPPYLDIDDVNDKTKQIRMRPVFTDDKNAVTLRSAFHNGAESNYLFKDDHENVNQDLFTTGKYSFTYLEAIK